MTADLSWRCVQVRVKSPYSNLDGGYVFEGQLFQDYPLYRNAEDGKVKTDCLRTPFLPMF